MAYISLKVKTEKNEARSSGENAGMNESDLKTLYLITFDETEKVVGIPKTTEYYTKIEDAAVKTGCDQDFGSFRKTIGDCQSGR